MAANDPLGNVSIILCTCEDAVEYSAQSRGHDEHGLSRLVLVRPPRDPDAMRRGSPPARKRSSGMPCSSPRSAKRWADHHLVIGTSRQRGRLRKNVRAPRDMAEQVVPLLATNRIAFVFGREVNGLDRKDLALCQEGRRRYVG